MFVVQSCTAVSRTNFAADITSSKISSSPDYKVGFYRLLGESACPFCNIFPISFFFEACNRQCLGLPFPSLPCPTAHRYQRGAGSSIKFCRLLVSQRGGKNYLLNEDNEKSNPKFRGRNLQTTSNRSRATTRCYAKPYRKIVESTVATQYVERQTLLRETYWLGKDNR